MPTASALKLPVYNARFADVEPHIQVGDAAFGAARVSRVSRVIGRETLGTVSHFAFLDRNARGRVILVESREGAGVRAIDFEKAVSNAPGAWHWKTIDRERYPDYDGVAACEAAWDYTGDEYGYAGIWWMWAARRLGLRMLFPAVTNDEWVASWPPVCSDLGSRCLRQQGKDFDPAKGEADAYTTPAQMWAFPLWKPAAYRIQPSVN